MACALVRGRLENHQQCGAAAALPPATPVDVKSAAQQLREIAMSTRLNAYTVAPEAMKPLALSR